mmetsp:Transcript_26855/g.31031  ORF Transcript_26855/g.31031 Transcript_26855/m.31031 type:complete len:98 (-) Transcript_26855:92-385(-)
MSSNAAILRGTCQSDPIDVLAPEQEKLVKHIEECSMPTYGSLPPPADAHTGGGLRCALLRGERKDFFLADSSIDFAFSTVGIKVCTNVRRQRQPPPR